MEDLIPKNLANFEFLILIFLGMVFTASVISSKIKIPFTIILVIIGILISLSSFSDFMPIDLSEMRFSPELILFFVIPPLIFEAMMKINNKEFKEIRISALLLATMGTVLATLAGGFILEQLTDIPPLLAYAFAALIAPTDAAIVIEIFKRIKVPKSISTLMQAEASFNDATGIIIFSAILSVALISGSDFSDLNNFDNQINIFENIENFLIEFFGGIAVGLLFAEITRRLHALIDDQFSETGLTLALVFGSVAVANSLGVSGLIAVAVAGLYFGNVTTKHETIISEKSRLASFDFWNMIAFFANSIAFLYLGLSMNILTIVEFLPLILVAFSVVLISRAISIYPILGLIGRYTREKIPLKWQHVVVLGGMRGALSVALVSTIPESDFKHILQTITFGVVLSSLLIQYPSLVSFIKKKNIMYDES